MTSQKSMMKEKPAHVEDTNIHMPIVGKHAIMKVGGVA